MIEPAEIADRIPAPVLGLMAILRANGHDAYVVGGSLRDVLLGREPGDWDLTTDARPERICALFPGAAYENRFGTVAVSRDRVVYEVTTYRSERGYADHRRPDVVEFGTTLEGDLARRDFTVNAMAWGTAEGGAGRAPDGAAGAPPGKPTATFVDPYGGREDLARRTIRAVGDPDARLAEDALRVLRAIRLATVLGFEIEAGTLAAITRRAADVRHLSGERVGDELGRLLLAPRPSAGLRLLATTGILEALVPELAAQAGIPQAKIAGDDLWAHTIQTVDAAPATLVLRLAALLHDVGKPATFAGGRFIRHDTVGAATSAAILDRLRAPREVRERVVRLVRHHMFSYEPSWSDAATRRFLRRVGVDLFDDLLTLRTADDIGSGLTADEPRTAELRRRCMEQLEARVPLGRGDLAIDGRDLIAELGLVPGPRLGRVLDRLMDRVVADPQLNDRTTLLALARRYVASTEEG